MSTHKTFKHTPLELGYDDLEVFTGSTGRKYTSPGGNRYPSITTVLGTLSRAGIQAWRQRIGEEEANKISRRAAARGTIVHDMAERFLNNEENYLGENPMPHTKFLFNSIKPTLERNINNIYLQEAALYSDHLGVAGRVDLIADWNGLTSCIDFKTSSRRKKREHIHSYFMQGAAYSIMVEERTGLPVSQVVIVMAIDDDPRPEIFIEKRDTWVPPLLDVIENYRKDSVFGRV
jgi:genome maintenance exonuclease 1